MIFCVVFCAFYCARFCRVLPFVASVLYATVVLPVGVIKDGDDDKTV